MNFPIPQVQEIGIGLGLGSGEFTELKQMTGGVIPWQLPATAPSQYKYACFLYCAFNIGKIEKDLGIVPSLTKF